MRIVSHRKLKEFFEQSGREDAKVPLENWYEIVEKADWHTFSDLKAMYPSVDYVGNQHYVFYIRGNKYRLVVVVKYIMGFVFIRFVGTHEEYDKIDCATV